MGLSERQTDALTNADVLAGLAVSRFSARD
jgi:hypothetical protein